MIIRPRLLINLFFCLLVALFSVTVAQAATPEKLNGRLLLQVEDRGKVWYVDPNTSLRAYLGSQDNALKVVRNFGVGISDANLNKIDKDRVFAKKLAGKIFLQVEAHGEAWYVNPIDLKKYYLGQPSDMFLVMKKLSLGITNKDLLKISVLAKYDESSASTDQLASNDPLAGTVATSTVPTLEPVVPVTPTCSTWTYGDWSVCDTVKLTKTRPVLASAPSGCVGGEPLVSQVCELSFNFNIAAGNIPTFVVTDKMAVDIVYNFENASKISTVSLNGLTIETNLDTSGVTYYNQTLLTIYGPQDKVLATKTIVNNATHELLFATPLSIAASSTMPLKVVISGFGGDLGSPHFIVRLLNILSDVPAASLKGLPVDSNIYRSR